MTQDGKHTPGPWAVIERADTIDGEPVIYVGKPDRREELRDYSLTHAEHDVARVYERDDARLIAAAPDLLAALREIAEALPESDGGKTPDRFVRGARAAIARATGGES